ncbi:TPA: dGTP triphosphohydrolase, partial [Legionella pneumophila]
MAISWMNSNICTFEGISRRTDVNHERSEYLVDYGTIIHKSQFRRLSNKAQVYLNPFIDYPRTRLTHSVEVEQIGRELSRFFVSKIVEKFDLKNESSFEKDFEDLVATLCLAHDIGQAPFGHRGEEVLHELMKKKDVEESNCFEANKQNIRLLLGNESRKPYEVTCALIDGIMKYKSSTFKQKSKYPGYYEFERIPLEKLFSISKTQNLRHPSCYIMEAADDIAYISSDLQDALKLNLMSKENVLSVFTEINLPESLYHLDKKNWVDFIYHSFDTDNFGVLSSLLIKAMIQNTKNNLGNFLENCCKNEDINDLPKLLDRYFKAGDCDLNILYFGAGKIYLSLKKDIYKNYILKAPEIARTELLAKKVIEDLWEIMESQLLSPKYNSTDLFKIIPEYVQRNISKAHRNE